MKAYIASILQSPHALLLPMGMVCCALAFIWIAVHFLLVMPAEQHVATLKREWGTARESLGLHKNAKVIHQKLNRVMNKFPVKDDFIPLALGITEEAKRNQVQLPSLSYRVEKPTEGLATKAIFEGAVKGRYDQLRRFIHQLETAEELLFIEDLDVISTGRESEEVVTCRMRIATYLRDMKE